MLYKDKFSNICYKNCSEAVNGNIYLYEKLCVKNCPENYTPDENNICIFEGEIKSEIKSTQKEFYEEINKPCIIFDLMNNLCDYNYINITNQTDFINRKKS